MYSISATKLFSTNTVIYKNFNRHVTWHENYKSGKARNANTTGKLQWDNLLPWLINQTHLCTNSRRHDVERHSSLWMNNVDILPFACLLSHTVLNSVFFKSAESLEFIGKQGAEIEIHFTNLCWSVYQFTNMYDRIPVRYITFINVIFMGNATVLTIQLTCESKMNSVRVILPNVYKSPC